MRNSAASTRSPTRKRERIGGFKTRPSSKLASGFRARRSSTLPARPPNQVCRIVGHVRRRQGGDGPDGRRPLSMQGPNSTSGKGLWPRRTSASCRSPPAGRQGQGGDRHARRRQRLAREQVRPTRRRSTSASSQPGEIREGDRGEGGYTPVVKGSESRLHRIRCSSVWRTISQDDPPSERFRRGPRSIGRAG